MKTAEEPQQVKSHKRVTDHELAVRDDRMFFTDRKHKSERVGGYDTTTTNREFEEML